MTTFLIGVAVGVGSVILVGGVVTIRLLGRGRSPSDWRPPTEPPAP